MTTYSGDGYDIHPLTKEEAEAEEKASRAETRRMWLAIGITVAVIVLLSALEQR